MDDVRAKGCIDSGSLLDLDSVNTPLCAFSVVKRQQFAHVYMPGQIYRRSFAPKEALVKGTLFPELWGVYPIPD